MRVKSMPKRARESEEVLVYKKAKTSKKQKALFSKYKNPQGRSAEVKFIDTVVSSSVTNAGVALLLNGCIQGTDIGNRIGRKIEMTSCSIDLIFGGGVIASANYALNNTDKIRVALVYDKQPNATAASYGDVYGSSSAATSAMQVRNNTTLDRFDVLKVWDECISTEGPNGIVFHDFIKMNLDVRFDSSNAGTIADITTGGLYLMVCDQNSTGTNTNTIQGICRVRFHDS